MNLCRKLRVDKNREFDFLLWLDRVDIEKVDNSLPSLLKIYKGSPVIIKLNKDEKIVQVEELFLT